ncbi:MAG: GNAT family N-acetyltransferase [Planctomycetota bacterium]
MLRRVVLDGRFRGLGLGAHLVEESAKKLGMPFIECLTVMGGYSRFLEKAGFVRIGKCPLSKEGRFIAALLSEAGNRRYSPSHTASGASFRTPTGGSSS